MSVNASFAPAGRVLRRMPNVFHGIARFAELARQRRSLSKLPDHLLDDLGLDRRSAQAEARRPFWDVPDHWHS